VEQDLLTTVDGCHAVCTPCAPFRKTCLRPFFCFVHGCNCVVICFYSHCWRGL